MFFIDAHTHYIPHEIHESSDDLFIALLNGTTPSDWQTVASASSPSIEVFPFLGLHPWRIESAPAQWDVDLRALLNDCSARGPVGIGEIGIDRVVQPPSLSAQQEVLDIQLAMSSELKIPVALHCVKAWSELLASLKRIKHRKVAKILHSYVGPEVLIPEFLNENCFFSLRLDQGGFQGKRGRELIKKIPIERILLETDTESGAFLTWQAYQSKIVEAYAQAAASYSITVKELASHIVKSFEGVFPGIQVGIRAQKKSSTPSQ